MKFYFQATRKGIHSFFFAMILLALYELFKVLFQGEGIYWINGVDAWFQYLLSFVPYKSWILSALIFLIGFIITYQDRKKGVRFRFGYLFFMLVESIIWALGVYYSLPLIMSSVMKWTPFTNISIENNIFNEYLNVIPIKAQISKKSPTLMQEIGLSLGAGFYEELFFRLILVYILAILFKVIGANTKHPLILIVIAVLSAALFSLAHYIGPYGDPFQVYSFLYRILFGLVMNGLFILRGFGITAWTHAWYDIFVFTIRAIVF